MPYEYRDGYVYNQNTGERKNKHRMNKARGIRYMRALYAAETSKAKKNDDEEGASKPKKGKHGSMADAQRRAMFASMTESGKYNPKKANAGGSAAGPAGAADKPAEKPEQTQEEQDAAKLERATAIVIDDIAKANNEFDAVTHESFVSGKLSGSGYEKSQATTIRSSKLGDFHRVIGDQQAEWSKLRRRLQNKELTYQELLHNYPNYSRVPGAKKKVDQGRKLFAVSDSKWWIAHSSEPIDSLLSLMPAETSKSANFRARGGQTIAGNLARGPDGKFARRTGAASTVTVHKPTKSRKVSYNAPGVSRIASAALHQFATGGTLDSEARNELVRAGLLTLSRTGEPQLSKIGQIITAANRNVSTGADIAHAHGLAAGLAHRGGGGRPAGGQRGGKGGKNDKNTGLSADLVVALRRLSAGKPADEKKLAALADVGLTFKKGNTWSLTPKGMDYMKAYRDKNPNADKNLDTQKDYGQSGRFITYKSADGRPAWIAVSSTAYRDRDKEIASLKALNADVERSYREVNAGEREDHGPLLFWHTPIELGRCNYRAMSGKSLIESGIFHDEQKAAMVKPDDQVSIRFLHPIDEPDKNGVFSNIYVIERSITPYGRAANPYTSIMKERNMAISEEKRKEFIARGGDAAMLDKLLESQKEVETNADRMGVAFKSDTDEAQTPEPEKASDTETTDPATESGDQAELVEESQKAAKPAKPADAAPMPDMAAMMPDMAQNAPDAAQNAQDAQDTEDMSGETGDAGDYVGDMSPAEMIMMIDSRLDAKLAPIIEAIGGLNTAAKMADALNEMKSIVGGFTAKKDAENAEISERVTKIDSRLKELEGDQPKIVTGANKPGYYASQSAEVPQRLKEATLKAAQADPLAAQVAPHVDAVLKMLGLGDQLGQNIE